MPPGDKLDEMDESNNKIHMNQRDMLVSLIRDVKFLKLELVTFRQDVKEKIESTFKDANQLEQRIRNLENWRWYMIGIMSTMMTIASLVYALIGHMK